MKSTRLLRLVGRLSIGLSAAGPCTALLASALLPACHDEAADADARTWVKRLDEPGKRSVAVQRLAKFFDDAMTKANKNRQDPQIVELVGQIVPPFAALYVDGTPDDATRKEILRVIGAAQDARGVPALVKALQSDPKKNPVDIQVAAQAVREMGLPLGKRKDVKLTEALWAAFSTVPASQTRDVAKDLREAVLAVQSPGFGAKCNSSIMLGDLSDPKVTDRRPDELQYWEPTCIELIKEMKLTSAVPRLVQILVTPDKKSLYGAAAGALVSMPRAAEPALAAAVTGTDSTLASLEAAYPDKGYVASTGDALGWIGGSLGSGAALAALSVADNDANRAKLAETLPRYPASQSAVVAFKSAYGKIAGADPAPQPAAAPAQGAPAPASAAATSPHVPLLVVAPYFFDTSLTDWLLKNLAAATGKEKDATALVTLASAIELMTPKQVAAVTAAVAKDGTSRETAMLKAASDVTQKCGTDPACYTSVLDQPIPPGPQGDTAAVKAAIMTGVYGTEATRNELVKRVDHVKSGAVRLVLAKAILHLAPTGDAAAADALDGVVARDHTGATPEGAVVQKIAQILRARTIH